MRSTAVFYVLVFSCAVLIAAGGEGQAAAIPVTNGLDLHLDASVYDSLLIESGLVTAWGDQSPNAYAAVVPTGAGAPTYVADGITLANGNKMPTVHFSGNVDGYNCYMQLSDPAACDLGATESVSVFAVVHDIDHPNWGVYLMHKMDATGYRLNTASAGLRLQTWGTIGNSYVYSAIPSWTVDIFGGVYDRTINQTTLYADGASLGTTTVADPGDTTATAEALVIGANPDSTARLLGNYCELLIYDRALSAVEAAQVNKYLQDKWVTGYRGPGDANGDGVVNGDDAAKLAENWLSSGKGWADGDFSYDGIVDDVDATIMAANWQGGASSASVPEPSSIALIIAGLLSIGLSMKKMSR